MENSRIFAHVDHTLLRATATWEEIQTLCDEALHYGCATVCVPPSFVGRIAALPQRPPICTVIGFPLGYDTAATKAACIRNAIADGADEVDAVVNLGAVKDGDFGAVTAEIAALKEAAQGHLLKVIVETCYLTEAEKIALCGCVTQGGADFIKTSTGFGTGGATLEDVALFRAHIGPGVRIKASGGIRTRQDMAAYLEAGCQRLGTSSAVKALA